jgi:RNA polymerase sigma-70 factor (ECF subfamily)
MEMSESVGRTEEKPVSDGWLVAAARRGDMRAFETLYRTHSGRVYGLCLRMTRRPDVAEDCVQQTFVRAWRNLASFEGRSSFGTWLHRIAVNEEQVAALDNEAQGNEPFDAADVMDVERAIQLLPDGARHAVVLQALYGYSHEEVAEMLGIAVGTCKAQVHRGRRLLREKLGLPEVES